MEQNIVAKVVKERLTRAERYTTREVLINRVPKSTWIDFMMLVDEQYCGDRGMALKGLMDLNSGLRPSSLDGVFEDLELLNRKYEMISGELERLKNPPVPARKKRIDGS